jgi:hypothetical protein
MRAYKSPPKAFVKWVPADGSSHESAMLSAVRGMRGAVQLLTGPIRSPHGRSVGFVMPKVARYPLEGLDLPDVHTFMVQLLQVGDVSLFTV